LKLQAKVLLLLTPCVILPLVVLGWLGHEQLRDVAERDKLREMSNQLRGVAALFNVEIRNAAANISLISESKEFRDYLRRRDQGRSRSLLLDTFERYQSAFPQYKQIRYLLPNGREAVGSTSEGGADAGQSKGDAEYFPSLANVAGDVHVAFRNNSDNQVIALTVTKPIGLSRQHSDGSPASTDLRGYLSFTIDPSYLERRTLVRSADTVATLLVTDAAGRVVLHPNDIRFGRTVSDDLFAALVQRVAGEKVLDVPLNGSTWRFQGRRMSNNLYAFAGAPKSELRGPVQTLVGLIALLTAGAIIITMTLLAIAIDKLFVKPINVLSGVARAMASGDLELELEATRNDELGDLSSSFHKIRDHLRSANNEARRLARHDSLTGLANRRNFNEQLRRALRHAERHAQFLVVLYIDLDDFKRINDTLGRDCGDKLLTELSERLRHGLKGYEHLSNGEAQESKPMIARVGADEFIVLIPSLTNPRQASVAAKRILRAVSKKFVFKKREHYVGASIGIAVFPSDGKNVDSLVQHADIAMHHAKEHGKNTYRYFQVAMNATAKKRVSLENALRKAIEREQFVLQYQPQVDASTGRLTGVEALIRWMHPHLGLVGPNQFVPVAEQSGLIAPIGEWAIREACRQNKAWQDAGGPKMSVAVNVSNQQFSSHDLPKIVEKALVSTGLLPQYLSLEVTETTIMHAKRAVSEMLTAIKALGAQISMDDFGTGYSSLGALRSLPIDRLKIDKTFVWDIEPDNREVPIISAIIHMAHSLDLEVIAEGVEQICQAEYLQSKGCHYLQGYLIGRAVAAEEIPSMFHGGNLIDANDVGRLAATA
jgi:diguanylate cyclase (GGDEF)-like protein